MVFLKTNITEYYNAYHVQKRQNKGAIETIWVAVFKSTLTYPPTLSASHPVVWLS